MKLTKVIVDKIQAPVDRDQAFYRDDELKGFALRVTSRGVKSFVVEKLVGKKVRRITVGRFGPFTVEQARKEANILLRKVATGIDPIVERKEQAASAMTVREIYEDYLNTKNLKARTVKDYNAIMRETFADWQDKPLRSLTKDMVAKRHKERGKQSEARANNAMRVLRALFNFAAAKHEDSTGKTMFPENPVDCLSKLGAWYRIKRRQTFIKFHQLASWSQSVMKLENEVIRDYLLFVLFTGLRFNEAATLQKKDVDIKDKTFSIIDTKNHETHTLPLSDYACEIIERRIELSPNQYVFPGSKENSPIVELRKQISKVIAETGIMFTVHDLRRTFITIAESLDISAYALKRLLNHKIPNDVTAGYIITDVERLRKPMQMITDYILEKVHM